MMTKLQLILLKDVSLKPFLVLLFAIYGHISLGLVRSQTNNNLAKLGNAVFFLFFLADVITVE